MADPLHALPGWLNAIGAMELREWRGALFLIVSMAKPRGKDKDKE